MLYLPFPYMYSIHIQYFPIPLPVSSSFIPLSLSLRLFLYSLFSLSLVLVLILFCFVAPAVSANCYELRNSILMGVKEGEMGSCGAWEDVHWKKLVSEPLRFIQSFYSCNKIWRIWVRHYINTDPKSPCVCFSVCLNPSPSWHVKMLDMDERRVRCFPGKQILLSINYWGLNSKEGNKQIEGNFQTCSSQQNVPWKNKSFKSSSKRDYCLVLSWIMMHLHMDAS